ncbi:mpv17-like protein [Lytechinus pictus]|uniref:mpv17-like protein n=1 Tax=Lytechinus pictus TaxID=7653 RepID=UPI001BB166A7|nr:mpv17-like protein isoform X1 [Lytechinus variegatus]
MASLSRLVVLKTKYIQPITVFARKNPLLANTITYAGLGGAAEFTQQAINRKSGERFEVRRIFNFVVVGVCFNGPVGHFWYRWLDRFILPTAKMALVKKMCLDQFICGSAFVAAFYTGMSILEGKDDIFEELRAKFLPTFKASCCFWSVAQVFNFYFLPTSLRIVYIASVSFLWTNFLAIMKRKDI